MSPRRHQDTDGVDVMEIGIQKPTTDRLKLSNSFVSEYDELKFIFDVILIFMNTDHLIQEYQVSMTIPKVRLEPPLEGFSENNKIESI